MNSFPLPHPEARRKGDPVVPPGTSSTFLTLKLKQWHQLRRWRAGGFQAVVLASAPRIFVLTSCRCFAD
eukprot:7681289-Pyramimonas_sp.AAC.1